jgi:hypothetical protein
VVKLYNHTSMASLRRELSRNGELRDLCGFDPCLGAGAVPTKDSCGRFLRSLLACQALISEIFHALLGELAGELPGLGRKLAVDSKALPSFIVRVPLDHDRRIFTPIARPSAKWRKAYDRRTAVERVNSRIDCVLGFEHHTIRGQAKMEVRIGLALVIMLAMALGRVRVGQLDQLRSLVAPVRLAAA